MVKSVDSYKVGSSSNKPSTQQDVSFVNSSYIQDQEENPPLSSDDDNSQNENSAEVQLNKLKIDFELEKSMIDMKYKQQIQALEKKTKPNNPITKRLMTKVQNEWKAAITKKEQEYQDKV